MHPSFFADVINGYFPEPYASLFNGIVFGTPLRSSPVFYQQIKQVGLLHLVVLSGMNITMLAAIIGLFTKSFYKKTATIITIISIVLFVLFVGPAAPIIRAAIMGIIGLIAIIYGRRAIALWSLTVSFILIAIFKFEWITTISLQLSYGATLGIILFGTPSATKPPMWNELKTSLAAQLFTTPLIFFAFHQVSFIAPLSNLLVSAMIAPLMFFGILTAILGKIHFALGYVPSLICLSMLFYMVKVIELLSKVPFGFVQF